MSRINPMDRASYIATSSRAARGETLEPPGRRIGPVPKWLALGLLLILAMVAAGGCARRADEYVPEAQLAESAVRRALSAWQADEAAGEIPDTKPAIFVTDTNRKPKQRLKSFEILGETPGRSGRTYVVELALESPTELVKAEYIVVGIDPLWVFRREDYELLMHWDHYMPEASDDPQAAKE